MTFSFVTGQKMSFRELVLKDTSSCRLDFKIYYPDSVAATRNLFKFYKDLYQFREMAESQNEVKGEKLITILDCYNNLLIDYNKLSIYYDLTYRTNVTKHYSRSITKEVNKEFAQSEEVLLKYIQGIDKDTLKHYYKRYKRLTTYEYYLEGILANKIVNVTKPTSKSESELVYSIYEKQFDAYNFITSTIDFKDIEIGNRKFNVKKDKQFLGNVEQSYNRQFAFVEYYNALGSKKNEYASTLISTVYFCDSLAKLKGFNSAAENYYNAKYFSNSQVSDLLARIIDSVHIYREYQEVRLKAKKKDLDTKDVHYWDLTYSPNFKREQYFLNTVRGIISKALKPLGSDYSKELDDLLNPVNGRMEISPSNSKKSGNFSRGFIGVSSIFYATTFEGYYNDVRIITHESTHAVHRQLMDRNKVLPIYASGPNYLFESFSIFSEFLLSDYMISNSPSKSEKAYFLEQYFDMKGMALFSIASDAFLEHKIHEGVINGTIKSADDLDSLNYLVNKTFSIWDPSQYPMLNRRWITASLFYEDPFYEINYVLGVMLALNYYHFYKTDREKFVEKYMTLLKNGFNDSPNKLLSTYLDINIYDNRTLDVAMRVVKSKTVQLEKLYKELSNN